MSIPSSGLIFYASLKEASSIAETGQSMTQVGSVVYGPNQGIDSALFWDDSYISITSGLSQLPYGTAARTFSIWQRTHYTPQNSTLLSYGINAQVNGNYQLLLINTNLLRVNQYGASYDLNTSSAGDPMDGQWHNIVYTQVNKAVSVYIDGVLAGSFSNTYDTPNGVQAFYIANPIYDTGSFRFRGRLASVRIYDRVLTTDQISQLAHEFSPKDYKSQTGVPKDSLIFHASLKEASATAQTGQTITWSGTQNVTTVDGIPCTTFNGNLYGTVDPLYNLNSNFTVSCWWRQTSSKTYARGVYMDYDSGAQSKACTIQGWGSDGLVLGYGGSSYNVNLYYSYNINTWYHLILVCDRTAGLSISYINGIPYGTTKFTAAQALQRALAIGADYSGNTKLTGYMAGLRIYDRALTLQECGALYRQYMGDASDSSVAPEPAPSQSGLLVNGLYLSALPPEKGSRGLLVNNVFFPLGVNDAQEQIQTFTNSVVELLGSYESDSGSAPA